MIKGTEIPFARPLDIREAEGKRLFEQHPNRRYSFLLPDLSLSFEADFLHRERHELHGQLTVRCGFAGARTVAGVLSQSNFNFSSDTSRTSRGKSCGERSKAKDIDWAGLLEEFCIHIDKAERYSEPAVSLADSSDEPAADDDATWMVDGISVLKQHPMVWFGAGGTGKSYFALYAAMKLSQQGARVLYCDWELTQHTHRNRLRGLAPGAALPDIQYLRCERPLVDESARILKTVKNLPIDYVICDSIGVAAGGAPESAEVANDYFRAVRTWGVGSLHLGHTSKTDPDQHKGIKKTVFGSTYWETNSRSLWHLERDESGPDSEAEANEFTIAFHHRKFTPGRLTGSRGYVLHFEGTHVGVRTADLRSSPSFVARLPLWQRLEGILKAGALNTETLAEEVGKPPNEVRALISRYDRTFTRLPDGRIGLRANYDS